MADQEIHIELTPASHDLFMEFWRDRENWNGEPLVNGNVLVDQSRAGNLPDLQRKGLIEIFNDDEGPAGGWNWVIFTWRGNVYGRVQDNLQQEEPQDD